MKVRVLRQHDNAHGEEFIKRVGRTYNHPSPEADIAAGLVEDAATPRRSAKSAAKPAAKRPAPRKRKPTARPAPVPAPTPVPAPRTEPEA